MSYVHVYTGNGKGKTTAALGISLRAVCAGKRVAFIQFVKGMEYSELKAWQYLPNFEIKQFGRNCFIRNNPSNEDINLSKKGLDYVKNLITNTDVNMIVLDEINIAIDYSLLSVDEVISVLELRHDNVEIILTGRYAKDELIEYADLVTNMEEIKHYYTKGVPARIGIEK